LLKNNNKIAPRIFKSYPQYNTVVCEHIGDFLSEYILRNPEELPQILNAASEYPTDINLMSREFAGFNIPSIVRSSLQISDRLRGEFNLLPYSRTSLSA